MSWTALPATAAWAHSGAQTGFEMAWFDWGSALAGGRTNAITPLRPPG